MLRLRGVTKTFFSGGARGAVRPALDRVDLDAPAGGLLCVLGPNGSGKTTLLKILAGLVAQDSGTAEVFGLDLPGSLREVQKIAGFSPEGERSFYGRLTGLENLRFFAALRGLHGRRFLDRLSSLEGELGLGEALACRYQRASAGMKQKLSLARALLHEPSLLLLDEPAKSLDAESARRLLELLLKDYLRRRDRLILWTAHRLDEVHGLATQSLTLAQGPVAGPDGARVEPASPA